MGGSRKWREFQPHEKLGLVLMAPVGLVIALAGMVTFGIGVSSLPHGFLTVPVGTAPVTEFTQLLIVLGVTGSILGITSVSVGFALCMPTY